MLLDLLDEVKALAEKLRQSEISQEEIAEWEKGRLEDVQDSDTRLGVMSPDLQKIAIGVEERYRLLLGIENPSEEVRKEKLLLRTLSENLWGLIKHEIPAVRDSEDDGFVIRKGFVIAGIKRTRHIGGVVIIG